MAEEQNLYDAVIIGGGPAGLTAALYLARARYRVIVVEKEYFGGQIAITNEVVNYPGIAKISGAELTETMRQQAEAFGAEFLLAEATGIEADSDIKVVHTTQGDLSCFGVLLALGASPRKVGFKGEDEFRGHGVAYCATCDGEFFTGKDVFVVGGGFAAAEESVFLTKYAKEVHILFRKADFSCAPAACEEARKNPKITIHPYSVVEEVAGDALPRTLRYKNVQTGETCEYHAPEGDTFGVFVLAGYAPATAWVKDLVELTEGGNIVTDAQQRTSTEGIYAAGDVCVKDLRQVVTATGEAAAAATQMERHLAAMQKQTGIIPQQPQKQEQEQKAASPVSSSSAASKSTDSAHAAASSDLFSPDMVAQLGAVFDRMARPVILRLSLDGTSVSAELKAYADQLAALTDKIKVEVASDAAVAPEERPCVQVCSEQGGWTGLAFHGVPGGHEFTSFVLGLYNAAGPGQPLDDGVRASIEALDQAIDIQVLVSLSCTMCPDTVVAAQRIASLNPKVTAQVYDINHFPALKDQYNVMSVPCLVINKGEKVSFGKKGITEVLNLL